MSKTFLFQAIQFNQKVLIQTIQFSISIVFGYTQLNVKIVLLQAIQFSISMQFKCEKNDFACFFGFYGISTLVGYLMLNPFL